MGQEIVYCTSCRAQQRHGDFEKKAAFRIEGQIYCKKCASEALRSLPAGTVQAFLTQIASSPRETSSPKESMTSRIQLAKSPRVPPPGGMEKPARNSLVILALVGIAGLLMLIGLFTTAADKNAPASASKLREVTVSYPSDPAPRTKTPEESRIEEAQRKLLEIQDADKSRRFAADEIRRRYAEFARVYADTSQGRTIGAWLKTTEPASAAATVETPTPVEPAVVEAKPDPAKVADAPKPPVPVNPITPNPKPVEPAPKPPALASKRSSVPEAAKLREAEAAYQKAFRPEQAKTPPDKVKLARVILDTAAASGAKDAELYILLREARDLATQGLDAKTALEAIDAKSASFEVDGMGEKVDLLTKTTVKGAPAIAWAGACLEVAEEAEEADDYEAALKLAGRAEGLGRAANDRGLEATAKERGKELSDLKRIADGLRAHFKSLQTRPDDPAANAAVGKFICLVKGDWKRGLSMLAKGSDPGLKTLAEQELGKPTDATMQAALGEAWAVQAEKETLSYKARARGRAAEWLGQAIPGLTGLAKVSAERTLATLGPVTRNKDRLTLDLGGGVKMELVYIKPGTFTMGGTQAPGSDWEADVRPEHRVTLTKGYSLGKYEVTRGQFAAFVKATGFKTEAEREGRAWDRAPSGGWAEIPGLNWQTPNVPQAEDHPVMCISWNDAKAFCDWAAKKSGRGVSLPTEAEWEYACRAGTKTRWSFGDGEAGIVEFGWTNKNSGGQTRPVGQKKPNPWGLYDMYGNVWEWCSDWAGSYGEDAVDPTGPTSGGRRCIRGGCWYDNAADSAFRYQPMPSYRSTRIGFRVALP